MVSYNRSNKRDCERFNLGYELGEESFQFRCWIKKLCFCCFFFKGTVMQIEKALINDGLRVSKVS